MSKVEVRHDREFGAAFLDDAALPGGRHLDPAARRLCSLFFTPAADVLAVLAPLARGVRTRG